ncbi:hypothetical protein DPMN_077455 [Dreissena polymorpha]|uniref:Uncharacterized protein n=1 Tax=Dreissena polymorpha TaxID=45954 RepID=A0A9D4BPC7_DREPO|nr:hypothetical protein DPMN_077455 [Dreissena polymorpha]
MAELLRMKGVQERCQCKGCLWQHSVFTATPVFICKQNPEVRGCAEVRTIVRDLISEQGWKLVVARFVV